MQVQTVDINKLIVTQSNDLARARYSMTLQEKRLVLILAAMVRKDHKTLYRYRIPVADLPRVLEVDKKNVYRETSKVCDKLLSRVVHINTEDGWRKFQWISCAEYKKHDEELGGAVLELQIHQEMKPYFLELKERFANLPLYHVAHLPSFHSVHLFLILWHESHNMTRPEFYLDLEDLKERMEVNDKYENFAHFDLRILRKAQQDYANTTPMCFKYELKKQGRKVIGIQFTVSPNDKPYQQSLELPQWLRYSQLPALNDSETKNEAQSLLLERLVDEFGIKLKQAREFLDKYDTEYITGNLDVVKKRHREGKVKNLAAYAFKALLNDYRNQEEQRVHQLKAQKRSMESQQSELEALYEEKRLQVISEVIETVSIAYLTEEFLPHLEKLRAKNTFADQAVKAIDNDLTRIEENILLRSYFHQFILSNYALPEYRDFEAWKKAHQG